MWDNVCSVHCIFSNYITVPEFPCNRKELKFCLTARSVLISGVNVLNITTSECTHPRPTLHFFPFHPFHPVAAGHRMAAPPRCHWPESCCAMGTTTAQLRLHPWARHGCSSQGQLLFTVIAPWNSLANGTWRCVCKALDVLCSEERRRKRFGHLGRVPAGMRQSRLLLEWTGAGNYILGPATPTPPGETFTCLPRGAAGKEPSAAERSQQLSCGRRVGAALLLWHEGGQKAGQASHNWCIFSRQQRWVHSRTVAPQAASARQDGKKCN